MCGPLRLVLPNFLVLRDINIYFARKRRLDGPRLGVACSCFRFSLIFPPFLLYRNVLYSLLQP